MKKWLAELSHCSLQLTTLLQQVIDLRNIVSNKNERYCVSTHAVNTDTIHNCMQVKLRYILNKIRSLPNEIKMCRICHQR